MNNNRAYMHGYYSFIQPCICTYLQRLIWVFFRLECAKLRTFYILHIFATNDVVALIKLNFKSI